MTNESVEHKKEFEEKVKRTLEIMLMNEAPMQIIGFSRLEAIRDGKKESPLTYSKGLRMIKEGKQENEILRYTHDKYLETLIGVKKESEILRETYNKIDTSKLSEETGKLIVEECLPLINEFCEQYLILLDKYIQSDLQPQEVPERLFKIRDRVMALSDEYEQLKASRLFEKAWMIGYISVGKMPKMDWIKEGKPVKINPDKFQLVLEKAKELGII